MLIETAHRWPHIATSVLYPLLRSNPHLGLAAGGATLARLTELPDIDIAVLEAIETLLPTGRHVDLDAAIATVTIRLTDHRLAVTDDVTHARLRTKLGHRLANAGLHQQAFAATAEAVSIHRRLAAANPAAHEPELARAVASLAIRLSKVGRRGEAVAAAAEALDLYRRLAATHPAVYERNLAAALTNLCATLSGLGRWEDALATAVEAVDIYPRLAGANPAAHEPDLAQALTNLGGDLSSLGRREEALTATGEAVDIYRRLAGANPAAHEPDLARGLEEFAWARAAGSLELPQAFAAAQEAVSRYERLALQLPEVFADQLENARETLARVLDGLGGRGDEATDIRQRTLTAEMKP